jgi:hypothetical protein
MMGRKSRLPTKQWARPSAKKKPVGLPTLVADNEKLGVFSAMRIHEISACFRIKENI